MRFAGANRPPDNRDGGYVVRDFNKVDPRFGTADDVGALAATHAIEYEETLMTLGLNVWSVAYADIIFVWGTGAIGYEGPVSTGYPS